MASVRMMMKVAQIARMRVHGIKDTVIAQAMGMSYGGLVRILRTQDFQDYQEAVLQGTLSKMDEAMAGKVNLLKQTMRLAVPEAMQTVIQVARQRRDLKSALVAAKEILDRDPDKTFAKERVAENATPSAGLPTTLLDMLTKEGDAVSTAIATKVDQTRVN